MRPSQYTPQSVCTGQRRNLPIKHWSIGKRSRGERLYCTRAALADNAAHMVPLAGPRPYPSQSLTSDREKPLRPIYEVTWTQLRQRGVNRVSTTMRWQVAIVKFAQFSRRKNSTSAASRQSSASCSLSDNVEYVQRFDGRRKLWTFPQRLCWHTSSDLSVSFMCVRVRTSGQIGERW